MLLTDFAEAAAVGDEHVKDLGRRPSQTWLVRGPHALESQYLGGVCGHEPFGDGQSPDADGAGWWAAALVALLEELGDHGLQLSGRRSRLTVDLNLGQDVSQAGEDLARVGHGHEVGAHAGGRLGQEAEI